MSISDDLLVAYIDGELPAAKRKEVKAFLAANPDQAMRVAQWQENDLALKQAFSLEEGDAAKIQPPIAHNDNQRLKQLTRYALAACLFLAIGFGGGFGLSRLQFGDEKYQLRVAAWANEAHEIFAVDANRPGEFDQDSADVATGWLKKRVGIDVSIPNLESNQLKFVGARLVGQGGRPAALMTYETASAERVSVFVQGHSEKLAEVGYWFFPTEDKTTCVWLNENIAFSVTGDMTDEQLKAIALNVRAGLKSNYRERSI